MLELILFACWLGFSVGFAALAFMLICSMFEDPK